MLCLVSEANRRQPRQRQVRQVSSSMDLDKASESIILHYIPSKERGASVEPRKGLLSPWQGRVSAVHWGWCRISCKPASGRYSNGRVHCCCVMAQGSHVPAQHKTVNQLLYCCTAPPAAWLIVAVIRATSGPECFAPAAGTCFCSVRYWLHKCQSGLQRSSRQGTRRCAMQQKSR